MKFAKDLKNIVIGLDFDGTCVAHEFPNVGKDIGAADVIKRLIKEYNVKIVLNTMRDKKYLKDAIKWCEKNSIPLYGINENPTQKHWTDSPKVFADLYIDDLNLGIPLIYNDSEKPYVDWKSVEKMLFGNSSTEQEYSNILKNEITKRNLRKK